MSPLITILLALCFGVYVVVLLGEAVVQRSIRPVWLQMAGLAVAFLVLRWSTGFPSPRQSFSSTTPVFAIALMLLCVVLGIAANYFFDLEQEFSWKTFLKPFLASPIVLFPLVGIVQTSSGIESLQLFYLALLAFQNGFFWRTVFKRAKRKIK